MPDNVFRGNPNLPENLGEILAPVGPSSISDSAKAVDYVNKRVGKAANRLGSFYGVDVRDFGQSHSIAVLTHGISDRVAVGHILWNKETGNIDDFQIVSQHRQNGKSAAKLLQEAWNYASADRSSGPIGGKVLPAAAWRLQRAHNPSYPGFSESPYSQERTSAGIPSKDITQEEYTATYSGLRDALNATPRILDRRGERLRPFLETENSQMATSNEEDFQSRRAQNNSARDYRAARASLSSIPTSTTVKGNYSPNLPSRNELVNSILANSESAPSGENDDAPPSVPPGACSNCGGRGHHVLSAPLDQEAVSSISRGESGSLMGAFKFEPDVSAHPSHSVVHPRAGERTTLIQSMDDLRGENIKEVTVYDNAVIAKQTCNTCGGSGRASDA
jgi:hypothetical protein